MVVMWAAEQKVSGLNPALGLFPLVFPPFFSLYFFSLLISFLISFSFPFFHACSASSMLKHFSEIVSLHWHKIFL